MALTHDTRRALAERVQRVTDRRGLPRLIVIDAIVGAAARAVRFHTPLSPIHDHPTVSPSV